MMNTKITLVPFFMLALLVGGTFVLVAVARALHKRHMLGIVLGVAACALVAALLFVPVMVRVQQPRTVVVSNRNSGTSTLVPGTTTLVQTGVGGEMRLGEQSDNLDTPQPPGQSMQMLAESENGPAEVQVVGPPEQNSTRGESWTPSDQHAFTASVYPSARSATVALSRAILKKQLAQMMPASIPLKQLLISGNADRQLLNALTKELRTALPSYCPVDLKEMQADASRRYGLEMSDKRNAMFEALRKSPGVRPEIQISSPPASQPETAQLEPWQAQLLIDVSKEQTGGSIGGQVKVTLRNSGADATYSAEYVDAEWAEKFEQWVRQHPGHQWILGTSEQLCATEADAKKQAIEAAVSELQRRLDEYVSDPQRGYAEFRGRRDPSWVRNQLAIDLREGRFSLDVFLQAFQRPYGQVYRAAVLVDASPAQLAQVGDKYWQHVEVVRKRELGLVTSSLCLVLVICVVYLFLNAATRGYYVWSMRAAAVVLAFGGIVSLLHFM